MSEPWSANCSLELLGNPRSTPNIHAAIQTDTDIGNRFFGTADQQCWNGCWKSHVLPVALFCLSKQSYFRPLANQSTELLVHLSPHHASQWHVLDVLLIRMCKLMFLVKPQQILIDSAQLDWLDDVCLHKACSCSSSTDASVLNFVLNFYPEESPRLALSILLF